MGFFRPGRPHALPLRTKRTGQGSSGVGRCYPVKIYAAKKSD